MLYVAQRHQLISRSTPVLRVLSLTHYPLLRPTPYHAIDVADDLFQLQNIFAGQNYNKPFFVTYVNTASFSFYLAGPLLRRWAASCKEFRMGRKTSVAESVQPISASR